MSIVVQKYGGSSRRRRRRHQARRPPDRRRPSKPGHDVVVAVSAMGDSTDELLDLAEQVSPLPPAARARHAADRGRADLDGAGRDGDLRPRLHRALVHRLAGRRDHRLGARPGQDHRHHARAHHAGARRRPRSRSWPASRASARTPRTSPRSAAAASDTTAVALAAALDAEVCEIYTDVDGVFTADPRLVPTARKLDRISTEEMLEMAASRREDPAPALRRVRPPLRHPGPRPVLLLPEGGHLDPARPPGGSRRHGAGDHRRHRPRPQRGQDHRGRRTRQGRRGRADLRGAGRGRDQHRHGRAEHLGPGHRPDRHLVHAAARGRPDRDGGAGQAAQRGRLRPT